MAVWMSAKRASTLPEVKKVYKRAGTGQGAFGVQTAGQSQTTGNPTSAPRGFLETIRFAVTQANGAALPAWIRKSPGTGSAPDWQNCQVDITAIPGVRKLRLTNGKWTGF